MPNKDISIRNVCANDVNDIFKISLLSFPIPWSIESIKKEIEDNNLAKYVVAVKNDTVIGYAGLWKILNEGHITNIAIHPEYRGVGIGTMLLKGLMDLCISESITDVTLEVRKSNLVAQNLYSKFGFSLEGVRKAYYADNKEDAIIMWNHSLQN